jgi:hypothetical protein
MSIALATTNNMMRAMGFNIPPHDDRIFDPDFGYLADYHLEGPDEPTVMDAAGWSDDTPVDKFDMLSVSEQLAYLKGMGYYFDA